MIFHWSSSFSQHEREVMAKDDEDQGYEVVEPKPQRKPAIAKTIVVKPVTKNPFTDLND
jgi:hypothetical protein